MIRFRHNKAVLAALAALALGAGAAACGGGGDSRTRNNEVTTTLDEFGNAASTTLFDWKATTTTEGSGTTDTVDPAETTVAPGPETTDATGTTVADATATTVAPSAGTQNIVTQSDGADGDSFGGAVALSSDGSTLAVGALYDDVNGNADQGSVTVFSRSGKNWVEEKVLTQSSGAKDDWFSGVVIRWRNACGRHRLRRLQRQRRRWFSVGICPCWRQLVATKDTHAHWWGGW
jgi:hypothetical protein